MISCRFEDQVFNGSLKIMGNQGLFAKIIIPASTFFPEPASSARKLGRKFCQFI